MEKPLYKNMLQELCQKNGYELPVYKTEKVAGPMHPPIFLSTVTVNGTEFTAMQTFNAIKPAEHAAAKLALESLSKCDYLVNVTEGNAGLMKTRFNQHCQKVYRKCPKFQTTSVGSQTAPKFLSTVEINGEHYSGEPQRTKRMAEGSAASVAMAAVGGYVSSSSLPPNFPLDSPDYATSTNGLNGAQSGRKRVHVENGAASVEPPKAVSRLDDSPFLSRLPLVDNFVKQSPSLDSSAQHVTPGAPSVPSGAENLATPVQISASQLAASPLGESKQSDPLPATSAPVVSDFPSVSDVKVEIVTPVKEIPATATVCKP